MSDERQQTNDEPEQPATYTRRTVLQTTLGVAATGLLAASAGGKAITALAASTPTRESADAATSGVIPSPAPNVPPAYTKRPPVFKSVRDIPGKGGPLKEVNAMWVSYNPPITTYNNNKYWQGLDQRLGVSWRPTLVPVDNYGTKFATQVAGGDIPDIIWLSGLATTYPQLIQQGAFTDLTSYLTGNAIKEYPNLAKLPSSAWPGAKQEGKIYGAPWPIPLPNSPNFYRRDWAEKVGYPHPKNSEEFFKMLTAFTKGDPNGDHKHDTYAIAEEYNLFYGMFRVPYNWRLNKDGSLTKDYETAEWKAALEYTRRAFAAGLYIPNFQTAGYTERYDTFIAGKAGIMDGGLVNILPLRTQLKTVDPKADVYVSVPPGHDGGEGYTYNSPGTFGYFAIPSKVGSDKATLQQLLRIFDWFAAPFGSEERIYKNNGIKGRDYTVQSDGEFVATSTGKAEVGSMWLIVNNETILFAPKYADAKIWQDAARDMAAVGINDPTLGLYSPALISQGPSLSQFATNAINDFVYGRKPLSDIGSFVQQWRSRGGDQIRHELEQSLQRAKQHSKS